MSTVRELKIGAQLNELVVARSFVQAVALEAGFSEADAAEIVLAVDEACSNLIRHAYKFTQNMEITLQVRSMRDGLVVSIFDTATSFDPHEVRSPNMKEYMEQFRHGGLGVHLMRRVMDKVEYFPSSGSLPHNELRLTKIRS